MSGVTILGISGIILPSLISCGPGKQTGSEDKGSERPNMVVIIADDLGWNDVGYHNQGIKTPNIDMMAKQGIEFNRYYVCSVSSPTRAALLTGRHPGRFGILSPLGDAPGMSAGTITIAGLLKQNGYDTGISGKWHLGADPEGRPGKYGFNSTYGYLRGQIDPVTHLYKDMSRNWHRNDSLIDEEGHATDLITYEAIRFINQPRDNKPFFLYVAYSVPHYPLEEPAEWTGMYMETIENESRRNNVASISHMDSGIGKILEALEKGGMSENTIVFFQSDNGGQRSWSSKTEYNGKFKPHDVLGDNTPLRGWKTSHYEGALRVPALMIWPGKIKPLKLEEPVNVTDLYPTLANLAGAQVSQDLKLDGFDFWPLVNGVAAPKDRIMYWRLNNSSAVRKGDWKLIHNGKDLSTGKDELFNVTLDPYEEKDVAGDNPEILMELKKELEKQRAMDAEKVVMSN